LSTEGTVRITGTQKYFVAHSKVKQGCLHGLTVTFGWKPVFDKKQAMAYHFIFPNRFGTGFCHLIISAMDKV
jgi:hypothetical protein